jgi:hypothetical protein
LIKWFILTLLITLPKALRAKKTLSVKLNGFFLGSWVEDRNTTESALAAFAVLMTALTSFSWPIVGGFKRPNVVTTFFIYFFQGFAYTNQKEV